MCLLSVRFPSFLPLPLPSLLSSGFGVESLACLRGYCWAVVVTSQLSGGVVWWLPPPAAASGAVLWAE